MRCGFMLSIMHCLALHKRVAANLHCCSQELHEVTLLTVAYIASHAQTDLGSSQLQELTRSLGGKAVVIETSRGRPWHHLRWLLLFVQD